MKKLTLYFSLLLFWPFLNAQTTIESLLSVPFPTNLTGSTDGKTIAWVFNDKGTRNFFIAKAPDFKARQLTKYSGDDGVDLGSPQLSSDGKWITYIKGNTNNSRGEPANPAQLQTSTERIIWIQSTESDSTRKVGAGTSQRFSPDGKQLVYINRGDVWLLSMQDNKEGSKLFSARTGAGSLRWSPNGSQIAFVTGRGDRAFVGVCDVATKTISYIDPSIDIDSEPAWSPDGKQLAFMRIPAVKNNLPFTPRREGHPWSIRLHDFPTGKTKEIWKANPGKGSVVFGSLPVVENKLIWAAGNQLVFPWEGNGWIQLYSVNTTTGQVKHLSTGQGEVENVEISPDLNSLYYACNIGDIDRRHIWKYDFKSGSAKQLTAGNIEWSPTWTENGLAYIYSTADRPAWPAMLWGDGNNTDLAGELFPGSFPKGSIVTPQAVNITATDGMIAPAQLFLPKNRKAGEKYPAIIFLHGGSRRQMLLGFNYGQYYSNAYALNQYFANQGYVVLSLNFRSGIGYGLEFREALNYGAQGASEFYDVLGAGLYLKGRDDVNPSQIALWGGSYGGYLTAMGLARASDLFACGVDIHGVHDWNEGIRNFVSSYNPEKMREFADLAFRSSPEHYVDGWKSPVLFIHGDDDRNVNFTETVRLAELLRDRNVYFEQLVFPDEVHSFLLHRNWVKAYEATFEFVNRQFGKK